MSKAADRLILGTRKGLLVLDRGNSGWRVRSASHLGSPVPYATLDRRTKTLWASLDHGHWGSKLQRSEDLGKTWREIPAPAYPKSARMKSYMTPKPVPAVLRYIWVIEPGPADRPQRMYLGTEPGGLFQSDDAGESFHLVKSLWNHPSRMESWTGGGRDFPGIHSVFVDPRDSRRILIGISCAGVFETTDEGKSWVVRNKGLKADFLPNPDAEVGHDPHFMAGCPSSPDVLWQQNHCGIFMSKDGAKSWTKVSQKNGPAHFGFAVAVDAKDPDTAWVVPAVSDEKRVAIDGALVVCRTKDGGKSWKSFRAGLPQKDSFDVVFRHGLDVRDGTLAFGTTTGNLYVSDDRGKNWGAVGTNLPPIYSVRFA
jgi:photosystem II stability/assembly factor-like uncharacterized protein